MERVARQKKGKPEKANTSEFLRKLTAIGKAQAVIEFNLDGTVLTANETFLQTFGYTLDEIQGKQLGCSRKWPIPTAPSTRPSGPN